MPSERVGDMTIEQLKAVINETVNDRVKGIRKLGGGRSVKEINESIRKHRWTPPPGSPTNLELLREDRDR